MNTDRIDFISSYCDRWCERCSYTSRCSAYACDIAIGMCGDVAQGIELAVGAPHLVDGEPRQPEWAEAYHRQARDTMTLRRGAAFAWRNRSMPCFVARLDEFLRN